jgi:hypothetical protein
VFASSPDHAELVSAHEAPRPAPIGGATAVADAARLERIGPNSHHRAPS